MRQGDLQLMMTGRMEGVSRKGKKACENDGAVVKKKR